MNENINVSILLCTFNGEAYLDKQLASYECQTHKNWRLWVSDDGSTDGTANILKKFQEKWGGDKVTILQGPKKGFVDNYISLALSKEINSDYYALSDQDDIWMPDKISRAIDWFITQKKESQPMLYCGRTNLINERSQYIGKSTMFSRPPSFANALMQCLGGANTMVYNHSTKLLFQHTTIEQKIIVSLDWWAYIVVSGCGGLVYYDPIPSVCYRQHSNNLMGSNTSWSARFVRICMLFEGQFKHWNDLNIQALLSIPNALTTENQKTLNDFIYFRKQPLIKRVWAFSRSKLYRQTLLGNLGLFAAVVFNKI